MEYKLEKEFDNILAEYAYVLRGVNTAEGGHISTLGSGNLEWAGKIAQHYKIDIPA